MKTTKRLLATLLTVIMLFGVVAVVANAASIKTTTSDYGYMVTTDAKISKAVTTVKVYGNYDYINFFISSNYDDMYFFYEIYSDKKMTKLVTADFTYCPDSGTYSWSPMITLKGVLATGTFYGVTYAARIDDSGNVTLSEKSLQEFKLSVNRSPKFNQKMVPLKSVTITANGPVIKWHKLSTDAVKYVIYRRSMSGTKWTKVGTVNGSTLSFTDKTTKDKNGKYIYTVKALNKSGTASRYLYNGLSCLYARTPKVSSVATTSDNRIQVKWNNTSGSAKYRVYRSENGGGWKLIANNVKGTSYYDTTAKSNGKNYKYTVRAVIPTTNGDAISHYVDTKKSVDFVAQPTLNPVSVVDNGLKITWGKVTGANAYTVYRKTLENGASWVSLGKVASGVTEFVDTTANENSAFIYTVRSEGKTSRGSYSGTGVEYIKLAEPEISNIQVTDSGISISWKSVRGATGYEVMKKNEEGTWEVYRTVTTEMYCYIYCNSYTKLELSVRAIKGDEKGPFNTESSVVTFVPQITSYKAVYTDYTKISWSDVSADEYRVYRKDTENENSEFELLYAGKETSYVDTNVEYDVEYRYEIRPVFDSVEEKEKITVQHIKKESIDKYIKSVNVIQKFGDDYPVDYSNYAGYKFEFDVTDSYKDRVIYLYALSDDGEYEYISYQPDDMTTEELYSNGFYIVVQDNSSIATTPIDAYNVKPQTEKCEKVSVVSYSLQNDGVKVTWNAVDNATKYIVQRWGFGVCYETEVVAEDAETCSAVIPKDYLTVYEPINLRIIAVHENGNETCSYYWDKINVYAAPNIFTIQATTNGLKTCWWGYDLNPDNYYYVFRKAEGETKWTKIGQVKSSGIGYDGYYSYTDKNVISGKKYTYTVRSYDPVRGEYTSYYNTKGYSATAK